MKKLLYSGRINLKMLRYFIVVAEELHFGNAAKRLNISQPPLSAQIKELEEALGFPLFIRDSRNVVLTLAGEMMQKEMSHLFDTIEHSLSRVAYVARNEQSQLNIGIIGSALWQQLLQQLKVYQTQFPEFTWSLHELPPSKQREALLNKKIDVGFWRCADLNISQELTCEKIAEERIVLAISNQHPLAKEKVLSLKQLTHEAFIFLTFNHSSFSQGLYDFCLKNDCTPNTLFQFDEPQTQLAFVTNNFGVALVPESTQAIAWPDVCFVPLKEHYNADLFAVYNPNNMHPALSALLELLTPAKAD